MTLLVLKSRRKCLRSRRVHSGSRICKGFFSVEAVALKYRKLNNITKSQDEAVYRAGLEHVLIAVPNKNNSIKIAQREQSNTLAVM